MWCYCVGAVVRCFLRLYFGGGDDNGDDIALLVDYCIVYCARVCASRVWAPFSWPSVDSGFVSACWSLVLFAGYC